MYFLNVMGLLFIVCGGYIGISYLIIKWQEKQRDKCTITKVEDGLYVISNGNNELRYVKDC